LILNPKKSKLITKRLNYNYEIQLVKKDIELYKILYIIMFWELPYVLVMTI